VLKFKRNNDGNYEIDFFTDVSLKTIKTITTQYECKRIDIDGIFIKEYNGWIFKDRLSQKIGPLFYTISKMENFLDEELNHYLKNLRKEKLKKLKLYGTKT
jgi:hypothetical protein